MMETPYGERVIMHELKELHEADHHMDIANCLRKA